MMCKLFKHEQQETHLDTKNEKTNTLSWILFIYYCVFFFFFCFVGGGGGGGGGWNF
jgi:hypothetical protein